MKALKFLVVFMGLLIFAGLGLIVYGLAKKSAEPDWRLFGDERPAAEATAPLAAFGDISLGLPEGHLIKSVRGDGRRIYVVTGPRAGGTNRVHVLDAATGRVLGTVGP